MTSKILWVCSLTVMTITLVASEAAAQRGRGWVWGPSGQGRGLSAAGRQVRGCLFGPRMAYELGITTAQQESIDKLYFKATENAMPLLRELDRTESELWSLNASAKIGDGSVEKLKRKAQELDKKIESVWSQYRQQVFALLTPKQRQQYERLDLRRGPHGGRGYGLGYGRGRGRVW